MAAKKRKPGKSAKHGPGKGLSGNPQRRAQQQQTRGAAQFARQQPQRAGPASPGPRSWPWWAESHRRVLDQVRAAEWPGRLLDIEALAGRLAGDEFHERMNAPGPGTGLTPSGWLSALTQAAIKAMHADLADDGREWPKLWAFCCGLADEEGREKLKAEADLIVGRGLVPAPGIPVPWYQPTAGADILMARDAYGSRFLVAASFSDPGQPDNPDHWYAWDLDWCSESFAVAAGAYDSTARALAEWRAFVGPSASAAELAVCPPELGLRLLDAALPGSLQTRGVIGDEPEDFVREIARLSRRADALAATLGRLPPRRPSRLLADSRDSAIEDFLDWYAGDFDDARDEAGDALDLILAEWGPDVTPDERAFWACSPRRIQSCAVILRDSYEPDWVNQALPLLPSWTQWCASRIALDAEATARALDAARAEAKILVSETYAVTEEGFSFRHRE